MCGEIAEATECGLCTAQPQYLLLVREIPSDHPYCSITIQSGYVQCIYHPHKCSLYTIMLENMLIIRFVFMRWHLRPLLTSFAAILRMSISPIPGTW